MYIILYIYYRTADLYLISVTKVNLNVENMINIIILFRTLCAALEYTSCEVNSMDEKSYRKDNLFGLLDNLRSPCVQCSLRRMHFVEYK
jgi:hypothetical protein